MPQATFNLSLKLAFSNIFSINPGTATYFEAVLIRTHSKGARSEGVPRGHVARPREQAGRGIVAVAACDSSVVLQLVSLLITFTFCQQRIPAQEAGGGRALRQGPEHISLLHLVVLPSVKEKLILTV